jgi:23S rRNA pseudouridine2605 synthase
VRLNVFLQQAGVGSRREAERLVADGRVTVNGLAATPTTPVNDGDEVGLNGRKIDASTRGLPRLFMLNKPLDILVTAEDPQGRPTIYDLPALQTSPYKKTLPRLMYVGRLDVNSEGLLLMSTDGAFAQLLMNPATALPRVYRVRVFGKLSDRQLAMIRKGVTVDRMRYRAADIVEEEDKGGRTNSWYRVTLYEGKNREIRKLMEHFGCVVNRLIRVQYGPFHLDKLEQGGLREISPQQVEVFAASLPKAKPAADME